MVIIVSFYELKGKFECEVFWVSCIEFKEILEKGIDFKWVKLIYFLIEDM